MTVDSIRFVVPEEVLFKSENTLSREEIAAYLRTVADNLDSGTAISLKAGSESVTLNPPARPTFEVKAEREGPTGNMTELSVEFELEWDENADREASGSGQLEIE
jgi:amphi-Trp domain-containing protein